MLKEHVRNLLGSIPWLGRDLRTPVALSVSCQLPFRVLSLGIACNSWLDFYWLIDWLIHFDLCSDSFINLYICLKHCRICLCLTVTDVFCRTDVKTYFWYFVHFLQVGLSCWFTHLLIFWLIDWFAFKRWFFISTLKFVLRLTVRIFF